MNRAPLADLIAAAGAVKGARRAKARMGERLNPVAEMIDCLRLAHRWAPECPTRASVAAELAAAWAGDAVRFKHGE